MIILFLQCTMYRKLPICLIITLLLYIPLLALTDRWNYGRRVKYTRCAWAGGTFFPVVLSCQFSVLVGNRFWLTYLCTQSTIQSWCCVSLFGSGRKQFLVRTFSIQLWCCVSFFGCGGKQFLVLRTYLVYNTVVQLCF